ncbi:MAG TPA: hypothetical protein PKV27_12025 [Ilumatobacteraceae bacterium]|nr:hypothetical protein [Ilumatobacteraceae bacterium]
MEPDEVDALDLDQVSRDLADVEAALADLDSGAYWASQVDPAASE